MSAPVSAIPLSSGAGLRIVPARASAENSD
jgi:hypothetical protein